MPPAGSGNSALRRGPAGSEAGPGRDGRTHVDSPMITAHRGASNQAPENTMPAFRRALELGADGIELDVHMSADGRLVVIHDETVDRTSNGKGLVKDKTLAELKELDFGSWFSEGFRGEKIPELEDVLELLSDRDVLLNIEIKNGPVFYPGIETAVADALQKYGMTDRTIIIYILLAIGGISWALININSYPMVVEMTSNKGTGKYTGYYYFFSMTAAILSPVLFGFIKDILGDSFLFIYSSIAMVLAFFFMMLVKHGEPAGKLNGTPVGTAGETSEEIPEETPQQTI